MTHCRCGKLFPHRRGMWITFFGFVKMSGVLCDGDNPRPPTNDPHNLPHFYTFYHHFGVLAYQNDTFSLMGDPYKDFFYY